MFTAYETKSDKPGLPAPLGRLYAVVNPAWPGIVKIGFTVDCAARLRSYQTGSPYQGYEVIAWSPLFENVKQVEYAIHASLEEHRVKGEWFRVSRERAIAAIRGAAQLSAIDKRKKKAAAPERHVIEYEAYPAEDDPFENAGVGDPWDDGE